MSSLRAKFALILVTAIICVVGLATMITILVLNFNHSRHTPRLTAEQLVLVRNLAIQGSQSVADPVAAPGSPDEALQTSIEGALRTIGADFSVVVTRPADGRQPIASMEVAPGRWIGVPVFDRPPRDGWLILAGYMVLVIAGTAAVAVVVANRVAQPLMLLEDAALAAANSDGTLPPLPEAGPAEIRTTARAINRLSQSLRQAMEGRMRLVAAAGHDLRTPMTRMRLRAEFLGESDREVWLRDLDELERIADSAIRLVHEATDATPREDVALDQLVARVATELHDMALPIEIAQTQAVRISASPLALTRALRNLLTNAATHGGGGVITLTRSGNEAVLAIEDRGPGIPPDVLDRVFEPFFRVDPARRQSLPGAGLGLAIAKEIVLRHRGTIELANRPGGGLSQRLTFRLAG